MLRTIGTVLNVKDVLNDAHNTFIKDSNRSVDPEEQVDEILKKDKAFNWSDEDEININFDNYPTGTPDRPANSQNQVKIIKKQKYKN